MAYETKVILKLIAQDVVKAKTVKEAYRAIKSAASVEGMELPSFDKMKKELESDEED